MNVRLNMALAAIMGYVTDTGPSLMVEVAADMVTNCSEFCKLEQEDLRELNDVESAITGIHELRDWLAVRVREALNAVTRHGYMRRVIFQPCWSTQRWKSLT